MILNWGGGGAIQVIGGGPPFNPVSLVTQGGFWRADMGSFSQTGGAGGTSTWADQSPNANNMAVSGTSTNNPTWASNSFNSAYNGITFTNNSVQNLSTVNPLTFNSTMLSAVVLLQTTNTGNGNRVMSFRVSGSDSAANAFSTQGSAPSNTTYDMQISGGVIVGNGGAAYTLSSGIPVMVGNVDTNGATYNTNLLINTVVQGSASTGTTYTYGSSTSSNNVFGLGSPGAGTSGMTVAYLLLTSYAMNSTDWNNLRLWTNSNWGTSF